MSKFFSVVSLLSLLMIFSFEISAQQIPPQFTKLFQEEQFQEVIKQVNASDDSQLSPGKKAYLTGVCHARLREFDQAVIYFKKAVKEEDSSIDLDYEYGQALYATNDLKLARYQLTKSASKGVNFTASAYYVAYISELLNDPVTAKSYYKKLIKDKKADKKFLQIAFFQYTKLLLKMMRAEEQSFKSVERNIVRLDISLPNYIPKYIFPLLKKTIEIDPDSPLTAEVEQFVRALQTEFKLDPNVMKNGRRLSAKRFYANLAQRLKYDDNVAVTKNASTIYETEAFVKNEFIINKRVLVIPELRLTYTKHKDQETPAVYKNDSFTIRSALRNKLEHTFNAQPASFLFDLEYASIYKDWRASHKRDYFSKSYTFGIGEQLYLSSSGETFFKVRRTNYEDETLFANYKGLNASLDQYIFFGSGQHLLIATVDLGQLDYYENEDYSNNTYLARFIYLAFEVVPTYTLQVIFSATLTDTKKLKEMRGYEKTINPSIDISKAITDKIRMSVNYNFIKNSSKSIYFQYEKQVVGTELSYTF